MWESASNSKEREELAYREGVMDSIEILLQLDNMNFEMTSEDAAREIRRALLGEEGEAN